MIKTFKYKLKLSKSQCNRLEQWLGVTRLVYNTALSVKIDAYQKLGKTVTRFNLQKELPEIKKEFEWIKDVNSQSLQCVLKRLDEAYKSFFRGGGFPKFAKKGKWKSIEFPQNVVIENNRIWLPKLGYVKYYNSRNIDSIIRNAKLVKEIDGWYACLCIESERTILASSDSQVGVDMGVAFFLTTSDGEVVENPRWFDKYKQDLTIAQRSVARKRKGSNNRQKAVCKLQRVHTKIKRCRKDYLHKVSTDLIFNNGLIAIEDLRLKNMSKSAKGTVETPGKNVRQKSGLNRSLLDLGVGDFFNMLEYKADWYGRALVKVNPQNTSRTCYSCGYVAKENRKIQSQFACVKCSYTANADINAAQNILGRAGLMLANVEGLPSCVG